MTTSSRRCDDRRRAGVVGRTSRARSTPGRCGLVNDPIQRPGRGGTGAGVGLRRLPHGSAPRRGRSRRRIALDRARPRGRRRVVERSARRQALRRRRPRRHRVAALAPADGAASAGAIGRTSAWRRRSPAGTRTVATPNSRSCPRTMPIRCRTRSRTSKPPRCCAPASSATGRCDERVPPGGRLGIYGFGASAHLAAQVALHEGATVHVMTRATDAQRLARELGAASVQGATDEPPEKLDAAILFAPAGELVPVAMAALDRGGTLAVAGIHLTDVPRLNYQEHLFEERQLRSVTANTRARRRRVARAGRGDPDPAHRRAVPARAGRSRPCRPRPRPLDRRGRARHLRMRRAGCWR